MKKTYLLLPIFFLASCSSSNDDSTLPNNGNNNDNSPVLVTKMTLDGDVSTLTYNGTKISQIKNITDGSITTFVYDGDLISQAATSGANSSVTTKYTYDAKNRLTKKATSGNDSGGLWTAESNYNYQSNNNVTILTTLTTPSSKRTETRNAVLNDDGSINSWTGTLTHTINNTSQTATVTLKPIVYDTKNSPLKNITGYSKIIDMEDETGSTHNTLSYNYTVNYNNGTGTEWTIFKSNFEYNTSGYPTKEIRSYYDKTGTTATGSTDVNTYEYNHL
ncbi:hypothetical protein [Chryseobacterium sp. PMSZPI]|uniref:hypothetical protein n=1 Tax=Chryseobacterium sp. PMSZPI TaxID=1033900 RepID=UPI000C32AE55|nr:hypothetical protein [Chryseobacterium sp. PMSZPI]PKF75229.1 hypothetical protein CW752_05355 [Chryseobacterium sp. PMSZPI]